MKLEEPIKINVSALKNNVGLNVSIDQVRDDLESMGAEVTGDKEADGTLVMYIGGNIEYSDIETCFDDINVDVDDYIIEDDADGLVNECDLAEDDELAECGYPTYENALDKFSDDKNLNEKKKDCCPKKKIVNEKKTAGSKKTANEEKKARFRGNAIPLSEALNGDYKNITKKHTLDDIIDSMTGRDEQRKINQKAIQKAMNESKTAELSEQLGQEKSQKIIDAIKNGRKTMHEKISINKKPMVDYTVEELTAICEKLEGQIVTLKEKNEGLNEADSAKIQAQIAKKEHLIEMIHDEIDFRNALQEADDENIFGDAFPNLNPNAETGDKSGDENKDDAPADDSEKSDDENKDDEDKNDEDNPDEDKKVEIGTIVITLDSKEHAEDLKQDLLDAGVPDEAIEISPAKEEEESGEEKSDDENAEEGSSSDENAEGNEGGSEENAEGGEEKQEESVKVGGKKLNEDGEDAPADDAATPADDNNGGNGGNRNGNGGADNNGGNNDGGNGIIDNGGGNNGGGDIPENTVPYAPAPSGYWALLNLIMAIISVLIGIIMLVRRAGKKDDEEDDGTDPDGTGSRAAYAASAADAEEEDQQDERKKKRMLSLIAAVLLAIGSVIAFILTEDLTNTMAFIDRYTILMAILLAGSVISFIFRDKDNDDEEEQGQEEPASGI